MAYKKLTRRNFLRGLTAGAVGAVGLRFANQGRASGPHGESVYKWAMVIDQEKCIGCGYCTLACRAHNDINPDISWNQVIEVDEMGGRKVYLPLPCMHCEDATCVQVCPVKASYHRPDGIVMMDYDLCIGCRYCEVACPYGARSFNWKEFTGENPAVPEWGYPEVERSPRGVVEKCSFCYQRIDRGLTSGMMPGVNANATPACVVACPTRARIFGDLNDPASEVSQLLAAHTNFRVKEDLGTEPRVYYLPVRVE